jgi:hypothetical protein
MLAENVNCAWPGFKKEFGSADVTRPLCCLPVNLWDEWLKTQAKKNCPPTPKRLRLQLRKLTQMHAKGLNLKAIMKASIRGGYEDFFESFHEELKSKGNR